MKENKRGPGHLVSTFRTLSPIAAMVMATHAMVTTAAWPAYAQTDPVPQQIVASIRAYNPTRWEGAQRIEVPTGRIATPGRVDWSHLRLVADGIEIPWTIREGKAHWKSNLSAPIDQPRAEDILLFWCAIPSGEWLQVDVIKGKPASGSAIESLNRFLTVVYEEMKVAIDPETGMLTEWTVSGESLLESPLVITPFVLVDEGLVVDLLPVRTVPLEGAVEVVTGEASRAAGDRLVAALTGAGVAARRVVEPTTANAIRLKIVENATTEGIEGDGFAIRQEATGAVHVTAATRLGLYQAAGEISRHLRKHGLAGGLPLVARNPVVNLRAAGFGGGRNEVDFSYESDAEWQRVFETLLDSGMNVFCSLGMWSNWKMPVSYRYMPELRSDSPGAYDESSGTKFSELDRHREHGLELMRYLHERGARVHSWLPIGCLPTTFAKAHPEAMAPGERGIPCFTHKTYRAYLDAFLRELIETYPIDGIVLIRDDNGGICTCERCKAYVANSRTKSPVWEQFLIIHQWLRGHAFRGDIMVYPYTDGMTPEIDRFLPEDLLIVGHGASVAALTRDHQRIGHMADTWLDNLFTYFRIPPSPRMRRLLGDRGTFFLGGAWRGTELPWVAIGRFGWEPTLTPNTLRYDWGERTFGAGNALAFVRVSKQYERLWEINARYLFPKAWMAMDPKSRARVDDEARTCWKEYQTALATLKESVDAENHVRWFARMELFSLYFESHLRCIARFGEIHDLVAAHARAVDSPEGLPADVRAKLLADYAQIDDRFERLRDALGQSDEPMLKLSRGKAFPFREWILGYHPYSLGPSLKRPQFAGELRAMASEMKAGRPFTLTLELQNTGFLPWTSEWGPVLMLSGDAARVGLPATWPFEGAPMAPGDRRTLELEGRIPAEPGEGRIELKFISPFQATAALATQEVRLAWK